MQSALIEAIRIGDPEITKLFKRPFDTPGGWVSYLEPYFGSGEGASINPILNRETRWHSDRFQALYIACWIYRPVEKGSYMIRLNEKQLKNAEASAKKLTRRASSHLEGQSYSARGGKDFGFIKGYGELLVIVHKDYLFLKMEGHSASHPSHLASWVYKAATGHGLTANKDLKNIAEKPGNKYGILARAAENYSNSYKALLKSLGFSGTTTTFMEVIGELHKRFPGVPFRSIDGSAALDDFLRSLMNDRKFTQSEVGAAFLGAKNDIDQIVRDLKSDEHRMRNNNDSPYGIDRVFEEIRLDPERIDRKLQKFIRAVQAASFEEVQRINNS